MMDHVYKPRSAGDWIATHPAAREGVVQLNAWDERAVVTHEDGKMILWRAMEGGWIAKRTRGVAGLQTPSMPLVQCAAVWLEAERAVMASAWGSLNEGSYKLVWVPAGGWRPAFWTGAHLDHDGRSILSVEPSDTAQEALERLERTADILEVSEALAAGELKKTPSP